MVSLTLRPSGIYDDVKREYSLQLRYHELGGTEYSTVAYVSQDTAREIIRAGAAYWLLGAPDSPEPQKSPSISPSMESDEVTWLNGLLAWCRPRLSKKVYQETLFDMIQKGRIPLDDDESPIVQSDHM